MIAEAALAQGGPVDRTAEVEAALSGLIEPWIGDLAEVVMVGVPGDGAAGTLGLAGSRAVPCAPVDAATLTRLAMRDPRLSVRVVPGVHQAEPAGLLQGHAVRAAGALAALPGFEGVLCLPGRESAWVHVSAGKVVSFLTCLTGTLFALVASDTGIGADMAGAGQDRAAFDRALSDVLSRPERIGAGLASPRAQMRLTGVPPGVAQARLAGMLIGAELAAARAYWLGRAVVVIGAPEVAVIYESALRSQGAVPRHLSAAACTVAGFAVARGPRP